MRRSVKGSSREGPLTSMTPPVRRISRSRRPSSGATAVARISESNDTRTPVSISLKRYRWYDITIIGIKGLSGKLPNLASVSIIAVLSRIPRPRFAGFSCCACTRNLWRCLLLAKPSLDLSSRKTGISPGSSMLSTYQRMRTLFFLKSPDADRSYWSRSAVSKYRLWTRSFGYSLSGRQTCRSKV